MTYGIEMAKWARTSMIISMIYCCGADIHRNFAPNAYMVDYYEYQSSQIYALKKRSIMCNICAKNTANMLNNIQLCFLKHMYIKS